MQCPHCGAMLPRDDARFCNHCGSSISIQQQRSSSSIISDNGSSSQEASSTPRQEEQKPVLREQVAQQPPASDETPSWLRKLDRSDPKKSLPGISSGTNVSNQTLLSGGWQAREAETISAHGLEEEPLPLIEPQPDEITDPAPIPLEKAALAQQPTVSEEPSTTIASEPENSTAETDKQTKSVTETVQSSPSLEERPQEDISPPSPQFAGRELRVKVWEPEEDVSETSSDDVEDLPTQIITSSSVAPDLLKAAAQPVPVPVESAREQVEQLDTVQLPSEPVREQIEEVDTVQVTAYPKPGPASANPPSLAGQVQNNVAQPANQQALMPGITARPAQRPPSLPGITPLPSVQRPLSQPGITPLPAHQQISMPGITPLPAQRDISSPGLSPQEPRPNVQQNVSAAPLPGRQQAVPPAMALSRRSRPRLPIIAAIILIPIVLLGGLAFGIVQTQRMNDLAVTQPWQQLHDEKLGVTFAYPSGWQTQADYAKSTLHVHDSSNTAQVNITVAKAPGGDVAQYLSQQAKQMQIADAKSGTPVSFAHASWTQIQGSTLQGGANYTTTLLATVHNSRLFTIGFLAPTSNYADQEKVNFSHLRASWSFL